MQIASFPCGKTKKMIIMCTDNISLYVSYIYLFIEFHKRSRENIWHFFVALSLTIMNRNEGKKFKETFTFVSGLISLFMDKRKTVLEFPTTLDLGCLIMTSSTTTEQAKQQQQQQQEGSAARVVQIELFCDLLLFFYILLVFWLFIAVSLAASATFY